MIDCNINYKEFDNMVRCADEKQDAISIIINCLEGGPKYMSYLRNKVEMDDEIFQFPLSKLEREKIVVIIQYGVQPKIIGLTKEYREKIARGDTISEK